MAINRRVDKLWNVPFIGIFAKKMNKLVPSATIWMNLKNIRLDKKAKRRHHDSIYFMFLNMQN